MNTNAEILLQVKSEIEKVFTEQTRIVNIDKESIDKLKKIHKRYKRKKDRDRVRKSLGFAKNEYITNLSYLSKIKSILELF